jgi:hypothetical protein
VAAEAAVLAIPQVVGADVAVPVRGFLQDALGAGGQSKVVPPGALAVPGGVDLDMGSVFRQERQEAFLELLGRLVDRDSDLDDALPRLVEHG